MKSKYDDTFYRLGRVPKRMAAENYRTWSLMKEALDREGSLHYQSLVMLADCHRTGEQGNVTIYSPASFVRYCIRSGWLVRV